MSSEARSSWRGAGRRLAVVALLGGGLLGLGHSVHAGGRSEAPLAGAGGQSAPSGALPFPKPGSHRGNWLELHGSFAVQDRGACLTCHERNDCSNCHDTQPPRDHTNSWRLRTHGFAAGADTSRCQTCHRQDMCVRCHNETPPRSHQGNWVADHCSWCHFGPGKSVEPGCGVCHKVTPH